MYDVLGCCGSIAEAEEVELAVENDDIDMSDIDRDDLLDAKCSDVSDKSDVDTESDVEDNECLISCNM